MTRTAHCCAVAAMTLACVNLGSCQRSEPQDAPAKSAPSNTAAPSTSIPAQSQPPAPDAASTAAVNPHAESLAAPVVVPTVDLALPQTVAVGNGDLVLTITEAAIEPRNSESMRLVFLVRMLNKQGQAAEFADQNFRLVMQDSVIKANGGLAETVGPGTESRARASAVPGPDQCRSAGTEDRIRWRDDRASRCVEAVSDGINSGNVVGCRVSCTCGMPARLPRHLRDAGHRARGAGAPRCNRRSPAIRRIRPPPARCARRSRVISSAPITRTACCIR